MRYLNRLWFFRQTSWRPSVAGKRFSRAVLYTREGCHLCEEAAALLKRYREWLPATLEVDIDRNEVLRERFGLHIPVVEFDGKIRFQGRVSEPLLRRLIEGTKPR